MLDFVKIRRLLELLKEKNFMRDWKEILILSHEILGVVIGLLNVPAISGSSAVVDNARLDHELESFSLELQGVVDTLPPEGETVQQFGNIALLFTLLRLLPSVIEFIGDNAPVEQGEGNEPV